MSFPIVGNTRIKDSLLTAISENRIPHALLITGENGTGKRTLSRFLANAAVCDADKRPCTTCRNCHLAIVGTHPDITIIAPEDGKKNIIVSQIRNLQNDVYIKPHMANCRVFIIEKADSMNEQSQNALLKVLEEPPANIYFILIAESSTSLLNTVISRCTKFSVVPPEISVAKEYLKSSTNFSEDEINSVLSETNGNIGLALQILDSKSQSVQSAAMDYIENLIRGNQAEMLKITAPFEKNRVEADLFLKELELIVAAEIKKNISKPLIAKSLNIFYYKLADLKETLRTNINLGLLFSALACAGADAYNQL